MNDFVFGEFVHVADQKGEIMQVVYVHQHEFSREHLWYRLRKAGGYVNPNEYQPESLFPIKEGWRVYVISFLDGDYELTKVWWSGRTGATAKAEFIAHLKEARGDNLINFNHIVSCKLAPILR